jgi:Flp pilus assembly protein TadG
VIAYAFSRRAHRARRGSTLPVVSILLVVLVGMVAFAIDIGAVAHARTELQATADAGDLAGLAKLYSSSGATQDFTAAKAEVNKYVGGSAGNYPGMVVADADIEFGYFTPTAALGTRFSTDLTKRQANALRVTLRRDGSTNPRQQMFFAPTLGKAHNNVTARATAWVPPALGALPESDLIPYVAHVDYFNAAAGLPARASNSAGFQNVSASDFSDNWVIGAPGTVPTAGHDGAKELLLFDGDQNAPGNFGSIDLGSASNGTPELARQLRNGPTQADFDILQSGKKLASDGSLQAPVTLGGDTGISNGTKDDWAAIIGQNKIIPLYSTVSGNGNNAAYNIVGFAGVRIVAVDLTGNPKRVWVQPTSFYSSKVSVAPAGSSGMIGVYGPPRLVLP